MIRPLLLSVGSRGDVEPFFALADNLNKSPSVERTYLAIPPELIYLAPLSPKLTIIPVKYGADEISKARHAKITSPTTDESDAEKVTHRVLEVLRTVMRRMVLPETRSIVQKAVSANVNVVVTTFLTFPIAQIVSEILKAPYINLQFQPMYPSAYYPEINFYADKASASIVSIQNGRTEEAHDDSNLATHHEIFKLMTENLVDDFNIERAKFSLPALSGDNVREISMGLADDTHVLIAMQSQLMPRAPDFPDRVRIVGALADSYIPVRWSATKSHADLARFIEAGPPPVVISYGSMIARDAAAHATRTLMLGLRAANVERIVLIPGRANLGLHHLDENSDAELLDWAQRSVFTAKGNVQYAWLFPRCAMVFCHCGAGTTGAALHAGIPVLGTPVITDQMFFVEVIARMKLGVRVGRVGFASVTAEEVELAVLAGKSEEIQGNVRAFAEEQKRRGEGVGKTCKIIQDISRDAAQIPDSSVQ